MGWVGELGRGKDPAAYGGARRALSSGDEQSARSARNYGGSGFTEPARAAFHEHFGPVIVSCERADLRPLPDRIEIYDDAGRRSVPLAPPGVPRIEVIDELYDAVVHGKPALHGGEWAAATLEICLAILRSGREAREITLTARCGSPA
jgi:phthalate 4,5-cis-dihydrodiol dehydrogenase